MQKEDELRQLIIKPSKGFGDLKRLLYLLRKNQIRQSDVAYEAGVRLIKQYRSRLGAEYYIILEQVLLAAIDVQQYEIAKNALKVLKQKFSQSHKILKLMGIWNEAIGEADKAVQTFNFVLEENNLDLDSKKLKIGLLRAEGETKKAVQELNEFIADNMCDKEAWLELADIYLETTNYQQALFCYEELCMLAPREFNYFLKCAEICYTLGGITNLKLARSYYSHCITNDSNNLTILFGLVQTCRAIENNKKGDKKNKELMDLGLEKIKKIYSKTASTASLANHFPFARFAIKA
mmetsp:Transcript_32142/g.37069  ORF Transcript_32142/g.37069 Transcript_32142/m.37069 type:complete len:293 (-) Transcript_32142:162-1040(-)